MVVVPPALHTLRAIVLGAAAVLGAVGLVAFVRVPSPEAAPANLRRADLDARVGCGTPCLGWAGAAREVDALPMGPSSEALAAVALVEPEPPLAATPPPATGRWARATGHEGDHEDEEDEDEDDKGEQEDRRGRKGGDGER